jgi:predicted phosphatase
MSLMLRTFEDSISGALYLSKEAWQSTPEGGSVSPEEIKRAFWGYTKDAKVEEGDILRVGRRSFYRFKNRIPYKKMVAGRVYGGSYYQYNSGYDVFIFNGFSDFSKKYRRDDAPPSFSTIQEVFTKYKVRSLKELERMKWDGDYDDGVNMNVTILGDNLWTGSPYYIFEGRFTRGSGAEKLSFWEVEEVEVPSNYIEEMLIEERMKMIQRFVGHVSYDMYKKGEITHDQHMEISWKKDNPINKYVYDNTLQYTDDQLMRDDNLLLELISKYIKENTNTEVTSEENPTPTTPELNSPDSVISSLKFADIDKDEVRAKELIEDTFLEKYDTVIFDLDGTIWDVLSAKGEGMGAYETKPPYKLVAPYIILDSEDNVIQLQKGIQDMLDLLDLTGKDIGIMSRGEDINKPFEAQPSTQLLKKFDIYKYFNYKIIYKAFGDKSQYVRPRGVTLFIDDDKSNVDNVNKRGDVDVLWRKAFKNWLDLLTFKENNRAQSDIS